MVTLLSTITLSNSAQIPLSAAGTIKRFPDFSSAYVAARNIDVWLPADYNSQKKYAVLYMHDGQMLYDSSLTWNKQAWHADQAVARLMRENKIQQCIIVGIWNGGKERHIEFCPQKPVATIPQTYLDSLMATGKRNNGETIFTGIIKSDDYLKFLVRELKPFIDQTFFTKKNRANTFIAGSSMGGLISLYAICEYPEIFGGAACLSTHWPVLFNNDNNPFPAAINQYLQQQLPDPKNHKIYFDYGDQTLDALYKVNQLRVDEIMKQKGFSDKNWITMEFTGDDHSEKSWSKRLHIPLEFLLRRKF